MKYFNNLKKLLALTVSAVMLTFLPNANVITASAEEPVTYYFMYSESDGDWRYQLGSAWDYGAESTPSYYLNENIKNGDIVVVGNGSIHMLTINVHLSNLTITNNTDMLAMISVTGGIDACYFTNNSCGSVTGTVANAYVYGNSLANFNNNVGNLYIYELDSDPAPTVGVTGTVSYFVSEDSDGSRKYYGKNFQADTFYMENGELQTDSGKYTQDISDSPASSATPAPTVQPASTPQPASTAQPAASTAQPASSKSGTSSDEYDEVPKTGETSFALWLCLAAALCFTGSLFLRKSER